MPMLPSTVKAPIFVARQLVRHEYLPWNEVSRRYVDDEPEFYVHLMYGVDVVLTRNRAVKVSVDVGDSDTS
jgi:thymidylate synthase ThyX